MEALYDDYEDEAFEEVHESYQEPNAIVYGYYSWECLMGGLVSRLFSVVYYFTELFVEFIEEMVLHDLRRNSCHEVYVFPRKEENTWLCSFDNPSRSSSNVNISSSLDCPTMFQRGYNGLSLSPHSAALLRCWLCNVAYVYRGLCLVPLLSLAYTWQLASSCLRCLSLCIRSLQNDVRSLVFRLQLTLDGSSKDIGWLQRETGLPSTRDGLFSNHSPLYFVNTKRYFSKMGLACHIAKIHSEASVEQNAWELKMYIEELYWGSGKRVLLLGHSKGGVDAAAALSIYWSSLRDKVAGLALVQSPYGGTPIASDILREGQVADLETFRVLEIIMKKIIKGDMQALEDLTYDKRKEFLNKNSIPKELPVVSFHTKANTCPRAILRMTEIANTKLPYFPLPFFNDTSSCSKELPIIIPLAACMALCAIHIQLRYGEDSDGLVTRKDAEVPGSVVVRLQEKLDHAWMVYSSWKKDHTEPDACEMCEALFSLLLEVAGEGNAYR